LNKKRCYLISVILIAAMFLINVNIIAKNSGSNIISNKTEVTQKDNTVNVTINSGNFEGLNGGVINSYRGRLEYDENIFKDITSGNFKTLNNWDNFVFNPKTNEFIVVNKEGITNGEDVVNFTLTLEDGAKANETSIRIEDVTTSDGNDDIQISNSSVKIDIIEEQNGLSSNSVINQPNIKNVNHKGEVSGVFNVGKSIFNPDNIVMVIFIIGIGAVVFCVIGRKKGLKLLIKSKAFIITATIVSAVVVVQATGTIHTLNTQGDLDGNRVLDYTDVSMIQSHLVNLEELPGDIARKADVNFDGKLTITDLCIVIEKIEKSTDYKLDISSRLDKFHFEKNEDIAYTFNATLENSSIIDEITINGDEYKVTSLLNSGEYSATIKAPSKSGLHNIRVTGVKLETGESLPVNIVDKIEVLKDSPQILNYEVKNIDTNGRMNISFDVEDNDNALTNSSIKMIQDNKESILKERVKVLNNSIDVVLQPGVDYKFLVKLDYNRDDGLLEDRDIDNTSEHIFEKGIKFILDYKFNLSNVKTYDKENIEKVDFDIEESIILGFNSSNITNFTPKSIIMNGDKYLVEPKKSRYEVEINKFTNTGQNDIKIERITLDNGVNFKVDKTVAVNISGEDKKSLGINIKDIAIIPNTKNNTIDINLNVHMYKDSIKNLKLLILNNANDIVFKEVVNDGVYSKSVDISDYLDTRYTIKVIANSGHTNEKIVYNEEVEYGPSVSVKKPKLSKTSLEKGENLTIRYTLKTNIKSNINKIIVGNIEVPVINQGNNIYSTTIQVGQNSGKQQMKLNKVILENGIEIESDHSEQIEILKSHISIGDYRTTDDINTKEMKFSFEIVDIDDAFVSANAQLLDKDGNVIKEQGLLKIGQNDVVFSVTGQKEYDFRVISTYKRDEDGKNIINKAVLDRPAQLIPNYALTVGSMWVYDNGIKVSYINRNNAINIRFTSENRSKFIPKKVTVSGNEYDVSHIKSNIYEVSITAFSSDGIKNIVIEEITLSNGRELLVTDNNSIQVDVLKIRPKADNFRYQNLSNSNVRANFDIIDTEDTITGYKVIVNDGISNIYTKDNLTGPTQQFEFPYNSSKVYNVKVLANYDLDSNTLDNTSNSYINEQIMVSNIKFNKEVIEFKDITDIELYEKVANKVKRVDSLDVTAFSPEKYIAKLKMDDMEPLYVKIRSGCVYNGKFLLELDYKNVGHYSNGLRADILTVSYGAINNNIIEKIYMQEIIDTISSNPNATINLKNDIDMGDFKYNGDTTISTQFKGIFNGNGYVIKNLSKPLFNDIDGAKINGLIIDNANISGAKVFFQIHHLMWQSMMYI